MAYARRSGPRPLFDGLSMIIHLLWVHPEFIQINEEWVEMLLLAEIHIKHERGENYLVLLLRNEYT